MRAIPVHRVGVETGQSRGSYILGLVLMVPAIFVLAASIMLLARLLPDHPYVQSYAMLLAIGSTLPLVLWLAGWVHGLSPMMLIAPDRRFDVGMLVRSALVSSLPMLVLVGNWLWRGEITWARVDWPMFLLLLPVTILTFAIQASAEEVLFRGYLAQALHRLIGHTAPAILIGAVLFTLAHEGGDQRAVWAMRTDIFISALFCSWTTLRFGRLEAAMGIHIANNLLVTWLIFTPDLPLPHLAARTDPDPPDFQDWLEVMEMLAAAALSIAFYCLAGVRTGFIEGRSPPRQT